MFYTFQGYPPPDVNGLYLKSNSQHNLEMLGRNWRKLVEELIKFLGSKMAFLNPQSMSKYFLRGVNNFTRAEILSHHPWQKVSKNHNFQNSSYKQKGKTPHFTRATYSWWKFSQFIKILCSEIFQQIIWF